MPPSPHTALVTEAQLRAWLGYTRRADLERALASRRVPIIRGKGGSVCTTLGAIESALGVGTLTAPPPVPDFL